MKNLTQKIILTFLVGLAFINQKEVVAQSFYDEKLYLFNMGYGKTNANFKFPDNPIYNVQVNHFPLSYEFYQRNFYFYSDVLTPLIDLCLGANNREFWWGFKEQGLVFNGGDWPLARLAFGAYIGDNVGIYAGGQWGYSHWKVDIGEGHDKQFVYDELLKTEVGGHTYGPGLHVVLDFEKILIRNSLMYNFVTQGFKGEKYTETFTWDVMATFRLEPENTVGIFANYVYSPDRIDVEISKFKIGASILFNR